MTPIFGRKKEPKEVFDENLRKADELWKSPKLWKSSGYKKLLEHIENAQEIAETVEVDQEDIVRLLSMKGSVFNMGYHMLDEALECYDEALSLNPRDFQSRVNRMQVLKSMEKWDEVLLDCDMILKLLPEFRGTIKIDFSVPGLETWGQIESMINQTRAFAWLNKGMFLDRSGKPEEAIKCFDKALKISPKNHNAWGGKALALVHLGKFKDAIPCYDKVLDIAQNAWAWYNKGVALHQLDKLREALECYDWAVKINPRYDSAWVNKGAVLIRLGKPEEAIECYDKALKMNPRDPLTWDNRGLALAYLGKFKDAIKCYDRALEIYPRYVRVWYDKGVALNSIGRHGEAKECFRKATEIDPSLVKKLKSLPGVTDRDRETE